jgi:hypothetical protein
MLDLVIAAAGGAAVTALIASAAVVVQALGARRRPASTVRFRLVERSEYPSLSPGEVARLLEYVNQLSIDEHPHAPSDATGLRVTIEVADPVPAPRPLAGA